MKQIVAIIAELENQGASIKLINDELQLSFESDNFDSDLIEKIKENKIELIKFLKKHSGRDVYEDITPIPHQKCYSLSNAQKRLWTICQLGDEVIAYNMPNSLFINDLDVSLFKDAIGEVIKRHESLRTVFKPDIEGDIKQWVIPSDEFIFKIAFEDLKSDKNREESLDEFLKKDAYKPFDLINGPLIRATIFRLDERSYVFSFNMHHIISDGWSMDVLTKDVMYYYTAFYKGNPPELEPLKIQYKDYAYWQVKQLEQQKFTKYRDYWINSLKGELPLLNLSVDSLRPKIKSYNGKRLITYFDILTTKELKKYCQSQKGSLFMGLMSLWNCLHYRYTGQSDLITGFPVTGRDHNDLDNQIGFYVNMLPLRLNLNGERSFNDFFQEVRSTILDAFEHQMYPFDCLVEDLNLKRDMSRSVLFDASLTLLNVGEDQSKVKANKTTPEEIIDLGDVVSKFDIDLSFREIGGEIQFLLEFNTDIYDKGFMNSLIKSFKHLVTAILENPNRPINEYEIISGLDRIRILDEFNNTRVPYPLNSTILDEFAIQVLNNASKIAIQFEDKLLSYKELDELSSKFANFLTENNEVSKGQFIALKLDKSEYILVCILGILKLGCAYVPIDSRYPDDRIQSILKNSNAVIIVDFEMVEYFISNKSKFSVRVDPVSFDTDDLAYIIYTSGSTGVPKGVMCTHGNVVSLVKSGGLVNLSSEDILLSTGSPSFDATTFEYWGMLLNGGRLVIVPQTTLLDNELLEQQVKKHKVTKMWLTSGLFNQIVEQQITLFSDLKSLIVGGDILMPKKINQVKRKYSKLQIFNGYGPTENTTFSTMFEIEGNYNRIPIGRPLPNRQVYILDEKMKPMPIGVVGEIYLGGAGIARGYLNDSDLTSKKFVLNPFVFSEEYLYKTGDIGRWLPDGTIDFIGRKDNQLKIRGYRIEIGEVEYILNKINALNEVVVIVRNNNKEEKELIAFYTGNISNSEAKEMAANKLPSFMVPDYFLSLKKFPLTSNEKIDRKVLAELEVTEFESGHEYVAPSSLLEKEVVSVWSIILGIPIDKIGLNDDFFMLGGHSLKATKLLGEYNQRFNKKVKIRELLEYSTPLGHAQVLIKAGQEIHQIIPNVAEMVSYPISDAQRRLWVLSQFEEGLVAYNMPAYFELEIENLAYFEKAIDFVVNRHESLRTVFQIDSNGEVRQRILTPETFNFKVDYQDYSQFSNSRERASHYVKEDAYRPFDLEKGPLIRASLIQLKSNRLAFYFNMHHIISDGWSIDILSKDVMQYYEACISGNTHNLNELRIQYKDYATWQLSQIDSSNFEHHKEYWKVLLSNEVPILELPGSKQRPKIRTANGNRLMTFVDPSLMNQLRRHCEVHGGTPFIALLTIWKMLLYRYTGQSDILVGSPVSGRDHIELHNQIGFYVNTLVLRKEINVYSGFKEIYYEVKESVLEAFEHQVYPFDRLVEQIKIPRDPSRNALIDNMISYQNSETAVDLQSIDFNEIIDQGYVASKFDLELSITEVGGALQVHMDYNSDIYTRGFMTQLVKHFIALLKESLLFAEIPLIKLNFISEVERHLIITEFNKSSDFTVEHKTVWEAFKASLKINASDCAIRCGDFEMTYTELDEYSDKVALFLTANFGIRLGDYIGVDLIKSQWTSVVIMGILKAGAVYVPIDVSFPKERKEYILKDSNAKLCIDQETFEIFISQFDSLEGNFEPKSTANDLVYVIYTSGSTGNPKGVIVNNNQLINKLFEEKQLFEVPNIVSYALTNTAFDVSILELVFPLCFGGTVVIPPENSQLDMFLTVDSLISGKVNILQGTPTYFKQFVQMLTLDRSKELNKTLSYLAIGGESLTYELVTLLKKYLPDVKINNHYGPTETTIDVIVSTDVQFVQHNIIGKPLGFSKAYIIDSFNNLLPIGLYGELIIGGPSVSLGYLNQPALMNEKFISNPFESDEIVYKTGDICRWTEDGEIEFLGRNDNQVKIRGNRIELGEVEKVVNELEEVNEVVVLAKKMNNLDKALVAYVKAEKSYETEDLRSELRKHLPEYMIPSFFVNVQEYPLTANGKLDEHALLLLEEGIVNTSDYVFPANKIESKLAEIYTQVLGFGPIGMNDNFFSIGGNSISVIHLNQRIKKEFEIEFNIVELFSKTSIRLVSNMIHESKVNGQQEAVEKELNIMKF